ncbi:uncharacterized protein C2845_PM05G26640 [Panicum miliaceum]|uniref:Uncharacterized protein n=1 Tax=Panicum miliaceum TaxID=4540 RepID=A0A3L6T1C1_PANMI|nr:uncharacterized protein C2845_PM05G26640 [Panicum miliaceum]
MADPDELGRRLAAVGVSEPPAAAAALESSSNNLFQVMRAVEDAEATIRQQLEENSRLKDELMLKTQELHRIRSEATNTNPTSSRGLHQDRTLDAHTNTFSGTPLGTAEAFKWGAGEPMLQDAMRHKYLEAAQSNGIPRKLSGDQSAGDSAYPSQLSTPSSRSLSPTRHRKEPDYDSRFNLSGQGALPVAELNSNVMWKQDLLAKVKEHEEEIVQLRRHLSDYSVKEAQILNEKHVLEKRIAYMRMAFDQQQQDLVDAASKALSYRQDIIEENIRLTYALQAAHQERSTFVSSLLPLLSEYNLQPSVLDAQSIVSNLKVLFKHLQEKLIITEEKLKESQYQITPWRAESSNNTSAAAQSPSHPPGNALVTSVKANLDIVPQQAYSHVQSPASSPVRTRRDWDLLGNENRQAIPSEVATTSAEHDNIGRTSPSTSNHNTKDVPQGTEHDSRAVRFNIESKDQNPSFKDLIRSDASENPEGTEAQIPQEPSAQWDTEVSPNIASGLDDANPPYPYLPTVLEEPGSSFSEVAEDDPLPAIDGLRITGEAFPGRELQASGYSINGTTSCNFEWVRHLDDGSVHFIEGARQPTYLVTADDVDSVLAIEVQPLDDRKRKGEIVKVYANDQRKITCDPETKELIKKILSTGHVSYEVLLPVRFLDMWEPAVLAIKREGYSIKCNGQRGVVVTEKFLQAMAINIPYGRPDEFSIVSADGAEYNLKPAENAPSRDAIVLILRLFRMKAVEKSKGRRKGIFFK